LSSIGTRRSRTAGSPPRRRLPGGPPHGSADFLRWGPYGPLLAGHPGLRLPRPGGRQGPGGFRRLCCVLCVVCCVLCVCVGNTHIDTRSIWRARTRQRNHIPHPSSRIPAIITQFFLALLTSPPASGYLPDSPHPGTDPPPQSHHRAPRPRRLRCGGEHVPPPLLPSPRLLPGGGQDTRQIVDLFEI